MLSTHLKVQDHGSICLVQPLTDFAKKWLKQHVQADAQWWGGGLVVEPRYLEDLLNGFQEHEEKDGHDSGRTRYP